MDKRVRRENAIQDIHEHLEEIKASAVEKVETLCERVVDEVLH